MNGSTASGLACLALLTALVPAGALAQQDHAGRTPEDGSELVTGDQTVSVRESTADDQIRNRLVEILVATKRFIDPQVRVDEGVVFLSGRTADDENRRWATELASRTEGVVAVVNNMALEEEPLWSLEPALRETRQVWRQLVRALPLLVIGLAVLLVTWGVARIAAGTTDRWLRRRVSSHLVRNVGQKLVLVAIGLFGVYLFLRVSGLTHFAVTVAGGTGIIGLVLGFAFRDIAENFLASVLISVQRPFRIGDTIEVDGHKGVVQKVTARGTVLMDFDGNHIQIANATVYKNTIRNLTANPKMRLTFAVGVGYDTGVQPAQQVALDVLRRHTAVLDDPEPVVLVEELAAATVNLRIYFWIDGHQHSTVKVRSSLMRMILRAFEDARISLPDEAREVIFPQPVPVQVLQAQAAQPPAREPAAAVAATGEHGEVTEAEGDLGSEVADIQRQADASREPEEGADILQTEPARG